MVYSSVERPSLRSLLRSKTTAVDWYEQELQRPASPAVVATTTSRAAVDGHYEVEKIVDMRPSTTQQGQFDYKVRWKGYTVSHDSWEPADNVATASEAVTSYLDGAPSMWQGLSQPLQWSALAYGDKLQVLVDGDWELAVINEGARGARVRLVRPRATAIAGT